MKGQESRNAMEFLASKIYLGLVDNCEKNIDCNAISRNTYEVPLCLVVPILLLRGEDLHSWLPPL